LVASQNLAAAGQLELALPSLAAGVYFIAVFSEDNPVGVKKVWLNQR
jgi:hypothetical protein